MCVCSVAVFSGFWCQTGSVLFLNAPGQCPAPLMIPELLRAGWKGLPESRARSATEFEIMTMKLQAGPRELPGLLWPGKGLSATQKGARAPQGVAAKLGGQASWILT